MNVREQGPGGLLMLFASGTMLYHIERIYPLVRNVEPGGALLACLFIASLLFLILGLLKSPWVRNSCGFLLGGGVLVGLAVAQIHTLQQGNRNPEMEQIYVAAGQVKAGLNPYDPQRPYAPGEYLRGSVTPIPRVSEGQRGYRHPVGACLVMVPLRIFDPAQRVDPRYLELAFLILSCLLIGTALGRNFFFLPLLLVLAVPTFLAAVLEGYTGFAWLFFCTMAWAVAPRRLLSGLLMGLACAIGLAAWFIAPFKVAVTARESGWKSARLQLVVILRVFGAVNAWWIVQNPGAWGESVTYEMRHPDPLLSKRSVGLVFLESQEYVQPLSAEVGPYWILVGAVMLGLLILMMMFPHALYALAPVMGVLPFWGFYRSDPSLFYFVPLLAMAGWASARIHPPQRRCVRTKNPGSCTA